MGDRKNEAKIVRRKQFKKGFPSKAAVEARISNAIDSASTLPQLKTALKTILNGQGQTPGIIDGLLDLDR